MARWMAQSRPDSTLRRWWRSKLQSQDEAIQVTGQSEGQRNKEAHPVCPSTRVITVNWLCLISLCRLCVLCVSVVVFPKQFIDHRGTENTEGAQRRRIITIGNWQLEISNEQIR